MFNYGNGSIGEAGDGPFALPTIGGQNFFPEPVRTGDFNGDGSPDVAASSSNPGTPNRAQGIDVLLNKGQPFVDQTEIDFPETAVNSSSEVEKILLQNTGGAPLVLGNLALSGTGASQFSAVKNGGTPVLNPYEGCYIDVTFSPTAPGNPTATLTLNFGDGVDSKTITLNGSTPPAYTVDPSSYSYGDTTAGYGPDARTHTFTITSTGGAPLNLGTPSLSGSGASAYEIVNPTACDTPLDPGQSCNIDVKFRPAGSPFGSRTATFDFVNSDAPFVPVMLEGAARQADYDVSPTSKDFGDAELGTDTRRDSQVFTVFSEATGWCRTTGHRSADRTLARSRSSGTTARRRSSHSRAVKSRSSSIRSPARSVPATRPSRSTRSAARHPGQG